MIVKRLLRAALVVTVITGGVGAATYVIAGPHRARAVMHRVQGDIQHRIDEMIDDPTALRSELIELESEYPERISQVRGDLAELQQQIAELEREEAICARVVELAAADRQSLEPLVSEAASVRVQSGDGTALVSYGRHVLTYERAASKLEQIRQTCISYQNRSADAAHDLVYMRQQSDRLSELLVRLEGERAQFQGQILGLSRQVDAIARNERLITLLEKRNRTIDQCGRYDLSSLDHLTSRLSEVRKRQEAELEFLASSHEQLDYENVARGQLRGEDVGERKMNIRPLEPSSMTTAQDR